MNNLEHDSYAFPGERYSSDDMNIGYGQGMTLRDWFAGQVEIAGIEFPDLNVAAQWLGIDPPGSGFIEQLEFVFKIEAKIRYMKADAMMEARKK